MRDAAGAPAPMGRRLAEIQRRLNSAVTVSELFAIAAGAALERSFQRAVVLDVDEYSLTAETSAQLADPASDDLRRRVLAEPVDLDRGSSEIQLLMGSHRTSGASGYVSVEALGLDTPAYAPIFIEDRAVGLLIADGPAQDDMEASVDDLLTLAHLVGLTAGIIVLKKRLHEFGSELRHLTVSATALVQESLAAPLTLPRDQGQGFVFTYPAPGGPINSDGPRDELFTPREDEIMRLVAAGLSNREIAQQLNLSVETVKGYVVRLLRKLSAQNRVEAAVRYLQRSGAL